MTMDAPRVFEEGTVTIVLGSGGCSVFAGAREVGMFESVTASVEPGRAPSVELRFARSHDRDVSVKIEESVRTVRTIPWVAVSG